MPTDPSPIVEVWLTQRTSDNMCCIQSFRLVLYRLTHRTTKGDWPAKISSGVRDRMKHQGDLPNPLWPLALPHWHMGRITSRQAQNCTYPWKCAYSAPQTAWWYWFIMLEISATIGVVGIQPLSGTWKCVFKLWETNCKGLRRLWQWNTRNLFR